MKINWNKKYTTYAIYAGIVCAALILLVFIGVYIQNVGAFVAKLISVLSPLLYGCVIAYIFMPIVNFFERKLLVNIRHGVVRRGVSVFFTYLLFLTFVTLLIYAVAPQIARSLNDLQTKLALYSDSFQDWMTSISESSDFMASIVSKINEVVDLSVLSSPLNTIIDLIYDLVGKFSPYIMGFLGSFVVQMSNIILGLVFAGYILCSKEFVFAQINKGMHALFKKEKIEQIRSEIAFVDKTFGKYLIGTFTDAIIVGIVTAVFLTIFRMPYIPLISVLVACTNIIPIFGPFIGAIPSFVFIFISDPIKAIWFVIIILVIQQLDGNIIAPRILGSSTGLSPIMVITAITIMGGIFGMIGMVIGVPIFAIFAKILYEKTEAKIAKNSEMADFQASETDLETADDGEDSASSADESGSGVDEQ